MGKDDLTKGDLKNQWIVNTELYKKIIRETLEKQGCFGRMSLPPICNLPQEICAKTKKEAGEKLAQTKADVSKSAIERLIQMEKCQDCTWIDKCFKVSILEAIRNATKT